MSRHLTRIADTVSSRGLSSGIRMGLVLLLWPGVDAELFAERFESRWGSGKRTMAEVEAGMRVKVIKRREQNQNRRRDNLREGETI